MEREQTPRRVPIRELVRYYLRLGLLGFGGPVALVGQMEREMVGERKWLTKEEMREGIAVCQSLPGPLAIQRSEEHTSELQSRLHLVCRLLLEKKKNTYENKISRDT